MSRPIFIHGQKVIVAKSTNKILIGAKVEISVINQPNRFTFNGRPNREYIYQFTHEGCEYGALESQLRPCLEPHEKSDFKSFGDLMNSFKRNRA